MWSGPHGSTDRKAKRRSSAPISADERQAMRVAAPHELVLQGYLHKQSQHLKLWKVRFFMLAKTELLYTKKSGRKPRGAWMLHELQVIDDQNEVDHGSNFVLELATPSRRIFLSAATEKERDAWVAAIRLLQAEADPTARRGLRAGSLVARTPSAEAAGHGAASVMLQPKERRRGADGKLRPRASKERREERRRRHLPKLKKPFTDVWLEEILTATREAVAGDDDESARLEALCFAGIPKEVRGRAWAWILGNKLQVNENLFKICKARARAVQLEMSLKRQADLSMQSAVKPMAAFTTPTKAERSEREDAVVASSHSSSPSPVSSSSSTRNDCTSTKRMASDDTDGDMPMLPLKSRDEESMNDGDFEGNTNGQIAESAPAIRPDMLKDAVGIAEMLVAHGERSIHLVNVDMPRTFGHHPLFKAGAEGTERTTEVLEAYACYRPDLGYVQGMSYLAATLCFHMDSFAAFKALVALLSSSLLFDMFRLESRTFHYFAIYNQIFEYELPELYRHFEAAGIDPEMYAVDWALTLFTRSLPLHLALRLWDCYVLLGTPFFFQASMGILALFEDTLLRMEAEQMVRFLHNLPKSVTSREIFDAIATVSLSCREITQLLEGGDLWSPDSTRSVQVTYPDSYE